MALKHSKNDSHIINNKPINLILIHLLSPGIQSPFFQGAYFWSLIYFSDFLETVVSALSGGWREEGGICFHQVGAFLFSDSGLHPARPPMHIHSIQQLILSCPKDELLDIPPTFYSQAVRSYPKTSLGWGQEVWGMFRIGGRLGGKWMVVWQSDSNTRYLFQWIGHPAVKYCKSKS